MDTGMQCATTGCETCFTTSENSKKFVDIAFCKPCRKERNKDLLVLIESDNKITIYQEEQVEEAETALNKLEANVRLDLHKTLDTIHELDSLVVKTKSGHMLTFCCISYVGHSTITRMEAQEEISLRISTGQISWGALVFKRGSRKDPEAASCFTVPGSKAWFNKHTSANSELSNVKVFVDDSDDHVNSVDTLVDVQSRLLNGGHSLIKLLNTSIHYDSVGNNDSDSSEEN